LYDYSVFCWFDTLGHARVFLQRKASFSLQTDSTNDHAGVRNGLSFQMADFHVTNWIRQNLGVPERLLKSGDISYAFRRRDL